MNQFILRILLITLLAVLTSSCGGGSGSGNDDNNAIANCELDKSKLDACKI